MKVKYCKYQSQKSKYFDDYTAAVQKGESPGIIVGIAQKYVVPPCLVAKYILQQYFEQNDESANSNESKVVTYLRDTALIPDMDLSYEVFLVSGYLYIMLLNCRFLYLYFNVLYCNFLVYTIR